MASRYLHSDRREDVYAWDREGRLLVIRLEQASDFGGPPRAASRRGRALVLTSAPSLLRGTLFTIHHLELARPYLDTALRSSTSLFLRSRHSSQHVVVLHHPFVAH
jgi:hypothetical protein